MTMISDVTRWMNFVVKYLIRWRIISCIPMVGLIPTVGWGSFVHGLKHGRQIKLGPMVMLYLKRGLWGSMVVWNGSIRTINLVLGLLILIWRTSINSGVTTSTISLQQCRDMASTSQMRVSQICIIYGWTTLISSNKWSTIIIIKM